MNREQLVALREELECAGRALCAASYVFESDFVSALDRVTHLLDLVEAELNPVEVGK